MNTNDNTIYREAAGYLSSRITGNPETAIILGSGLGSLADQIEEAVVIPYSEIPHFMHSTAAGHKGNFICGRFTSLINGTVSPRMIREDMISFRCALTKVSLRI